MPENIHKYFKQYKGETIQKYPKISPNVSGNAKDEQKKTPSGVERIDQIKQNRRPATGLQLIELAQSGLELLLI